jgi:hypothetical protein
MLNKLPFLYKVAGLKKQKQGKRLFTGIGSGAMEVNTHYCAGADFSGNAWRVKFTPGACE